MKKRICFLLLIIFILSLVPTRAQENINYKNLEIISMPCPSQSEEAALHFSWVSGSSVGAIRIWEQGDETTAQTIESSVTEIENYYAHLVIVTGLKPETVYEYSVLWNLEGGASPSAGTFLTSTRTAADANARNYRNLSMTPGMNETIMRFTFHSGAATGGIRIWEQNDLTSARTVATSVTSSFTVQRPSNEGGLATYNVHQAAVTALKPDTEYRYEVLWGSNGKSDEKFFRTGGASNFQFLIASDIQIGTGGIETFEPGRDHYDWQNTMRITASVFPDARFMLSLGDNVTSATTTGNPQNITPLQLATAQRRLDFVFAPPELHRLPIMPVVGNHDGLLVSSGENNIMPHLWHRHYNTPIPTTPNT